MPLKTSFIDALCATFSRFVLTHASETDLRQRSFARTEAHVPGGEELLFGVRSAAIHRRCV